MTILFFILVILGTINFLIVLAYFKKVKRMDSGEIRLTAVGRKDNWKTHFFDKLKILLTGDIRSVKSIYRRTKPKDVVIYFGLFLAGIYIDLMYLNLNVIITGIVLLVMLLYIHYKVSQKKIRILFEAEFSEALNIINSSLSSGNTIVNGITQCGNKLRGTVVGPELKIISRRLSIGEDVRSVLLDSYRRLPYREYYFFILAVMININGGGQVRDVMSRLAKQISDAKITERKKFAMTSEARMSVKVLALIPIGFIFIMNFLSPENFDILINNESGQFILYYAVSSVCLGLAIIWNMMNKAV